MNGPHAQKSLPLFTPLFVMTIVLLSTPRTGIAQSGTYTFTSGQATDTGNTITSSEAGIALTVSAADVSGAQPVDLASLACCGTSSDGVAAGNTITSMTLTFASTVSVTTLRIVNSQHHAQAYRFTANDGQTATSSSVASQTSANVTLNFIDITSITIVDSDNSASFTGSMFIGMDDLALDASLPVELTAFDAIIDQSDVVLHWTTASERNNSGFSIEHEASAEHEDALALWNPIAFVEGHGTTVEEQSYRFRVENVTAGTHRFRLKQIDFDGAFAYSPTVEVVLDLAQTYTLSALYPNPLRGEGTFTLSLGHPQLVQIRVFDVLGREVALVHDGLLASGQTHRFVTDVQSWSAGSYVLKVDSERFSTSQIITVLQ